MYNLRSVWMPLQPENCQMISWLRELLKKASTQRSVVGHKPILVDINRPVKIWPIKIYIKTLIAQKITRKNMDIGNSYSLNNNYGFFFLENSMDLNSGGCNLVGNHLVSNALHIFCLRHQTFHWVISPSLLINCGWYGFDSVLGLGSAEIHY